MFLATHLLRLGDSGIASIREFYCLLWHSAIRSRWWNPCVITLSDFIDHRSWLLILLIITSRKSRPRRSPKLCAILFCIPLVLGKTIEFSVCQSLNNMFTQRCSLSYLLALLCLSNLTFALTPWESIHQTIHTYPLAIDSKDFALFSKVPSLLCSRSNNGHVALCSKSPYVLASLSLTYLVTGIRTRRLRQLHRRSVQPQRSISNRDRSCSIRGQCLLPAPPRHHCHRYPQQQG